MRVKIIAYNELGYRMEIAILSEQQVHMTTTGMEDISLRSISTKYLSGVGLVPSAFPEAVKFDIIIES